MFFTLEKFERRVQELAQRRYLGLTSIAPLTAMPGTLDPDMPYHGAPPQIIGDSMTIDDTFNGRDRYLWLEKTVCLPPERPDCQVVGLFHFGETGGGFNRGFESLLYVDGHPYQGVDSYHNEVIFSPYTEAPLRLTFLLWTGLEGGGPQKTQYHRLQQADIGYLHKTTDTLYYLARAITETLRLLPQEDEHASLLTAALDRALLCIDWDEETFYSSVDAAYQTLLTALNQIPKHTDVTVYGIGHTHIDVAWLWRLKHTREKAQRSFSTALHLMNLYDDYIFLQTQPQLYRYIQEDHPELFERIRRKIAEGQWEADGGMWVEADCNIPSGESLVRQFLQGTRFLMQEFGQKCSYLWLPDVFGYSWALPQILKLCEIHTFMTTKISWNQYNTIPHDLFLWRGIDGSEVMTYFIDTPGEGQDTSTRYSTYNGMMSPHAVIGSWRKFKNKELSHDILISYGYGDGGGGVTRDMLEMRRAMDLLPGLPHVKTSTAGHFFDILHAHLAQTDRYIPVWDGELYLEYHRGTYTSQAYNKKTNRQLEHDLLTTEWLSSLAYLSGASYNQEDLETVWRLLLLHQFHDIIPGSSIHEVYEDSRANYAQANKILSSVRAKALQHLVTPSEYTFSVYSPKSFAGSELVQIPVQEPGIFLDEGGNLLDSQKTDEGYLVLIQTWPFSTTSLCFLSGEADVPPTPFHRERNRLETPFYSIAWNEEGQWTALYDKEAERSILAPGALGNVLEVFEDKPVNYDAWDVDIFYTQKMETMHLCQEPEVLELGPLRAVLRFTYVYRHSRLTQDLSVYRDSRRIDLRTHVDWHEEHRLLKAAFYTDIRSTKATYDIQFGHVERPTHWNTSWDWARFEVCAQQWADLSEQGYGVSLLSDGKYGYNIKDRAMKISLLKSAKHPDTQADMGEHDFTYSLYPHKGSVTEGGTIEEAHRLNLPAQVISGSFSDTRRILWLSSSQVQIDAIKKAEDEDCLVVHLHECRGGRAQIHFGSDYPLRKVVPCNLLEHDLSPALPEDTRTLLFHPFEIKALKLWF